MSDVLFITGHTFAFRSDLKALGARWNPDLQGWTAPVRRFPDVDALTHIASVEIALRDTATGVTTPLPRVIRNGRLCYCCPSARPDD